MVSPACERQGTELTGGRYEERHAAHTVSQIRDFMKKLNKLQHTHKSLAMHVNLAERIQRVTRETAFHRWAFGVGLGERAYNC